MGLDISVYIGAYVEIKAPPMSVVDEVRECPTHGSMKLLNMSFGFCPLCGQEAVIVEKRSTTSHTLYSLLGDEYEDVLSEVEQHRPAGLIIATGNSYKDKSHIRVDTDVNTISEIRPEIPTELVAAFNEFYADVLAVLRQRAESVEVKFGVITYWS